jgi:hypothetical protein
MMAGLDRFAKASQAMFWRWWQDRPAKAEALADATGDRKSFYLEGTSHEFILPELLREPSKQARTAARSKRRAARLD